MGLYNFDFDSIIGSSILSNSDIINPLFVTSNPSVVESVEVIKVNSNLKEIKSIRTYELNNYTFEIGYDINFRVSNLLNVEFIKQLRYIKSKTPKIEYFDRGCFRNLISRRDPNIILSSLLDCSWVITSDKISKELSKLVDYKIVDKSVSCLNKKSGIINGINIFTSDKVRDNDIFIGDSDSLTAIVNKKLKIKQNKSLSFEFLFCDNNIRKITLQ